MNYVRFILFILFFWFLNIFFLSLSAEASFLGNLFLLFFKEKRDDNSIKCRNRDTIPLCLTASSKCAFSFSSTSSSCFCSTDCCAHKILTLISFKPHHFAYIFGKMIPRNSGEMVLNHTERTRAVKVHWLDCVVVCVYVCTLQRIMLCRFRCIETHKNECFELFKWTLKGKCTKRYELNYRTMKQI